MRGAVSLSSYLVGREKIALMRRDWATRAIANCDEVEQFLRAEGFTITDAATLPFLEQVRMFQSAQLVFGVIGSGFTGLITPPTKYGSWQLDPPPGGIDFSMHWRNTEMDDGPRSAASRNGMARSLCGTLHSRYLSSSPRWPE